MLTIRDTRVFHGPSLWAPVPAIVLEVAIGELEDVLRTQTPVFFERLTGLIPSLRDRGDVVNRAEGGLQRLLLDHVALALQQLAGAEVNFAQTHPTTKRGVYTVVYQFQHEDVGRAAGEFAVRLLNHLLYQGEPDFAFDISRNRDRRCNRRRAVARFVEYHLGRHSFHADRSHYSNCDATMAREHHSQFLGRYRRLLRKSGNRQQ